MIKKYIDIDGVILKYEPSDYPTRFLTIKHYFKNQPLLIHMIPEDFIILGKITTEEERRDKIAMIKKIFPKNKYILTKKPKHKKVNPKGCILIDDYNKNLEDWQSLGGIPVKFLNEINSPREDMLCVNKDDFIEVLSAFDSTLNS